MCTRYKRSGDEDNSAIPPHLDFCPTTNEWADNAGGDPAGEPKGEAAKLETPRDSGWLRDTCPILAIGKHDGQISVN